jgi:hypothetical protein
VLLNRLVFQEWSTTLENCLEFDILSKKLEKLVPKYSKYLGERNQGAERRLPTASAILKKR